MDEYQIDDERAFLHGTPRDRLFAGSRLARAESGRRFLSSVAMARSRSDEIRANALISLPIGTEIDLLEPVVRTFLSCEESAQMRWLGIQRSVKEGMFQLTSLVESMIGDDASIGWLASVELSGLVERALVLLRARRQDPAFGDDVI